MYFSFKWGLFLVIVQNQVLTMNEVSGGKQEIASTSAWEALASQSVTTLTGMHHHHRHQPLQQDSNSPVQQVIVPTPVKLQAPILSPTQNVEHCSVLTQMQQQPPLVAQVKKEEIIFLPPPNVIIFTIFFFLQILLVANAERFR